jgi:1-acyl-sn-glycerol-3-phosphate acyltransferase
VNIVRKTIILSTQRIVGFVLRILYRLEVHGIENIPPTGPVIIASNHLSYLDPPAIGAVLPGRFRFVATDDLFAVRPLAALLRIYRTIAIKRDAPDRRAYHEISAALRSGEIVVLFVEGTRSWDGHLHPLQPGAARIALLEGVPVVPTTVTGTFEAWPRTKHFPKPCRKVILKFHRPIWVQKPADRAQIRELTVRLCNDIAAPIRRRLEAYHRLRACLPRQARGAKPTRQDHSSC